MAGQLAAAVVGTGFMGRVHVEALRRIDVPIAGILGSDAKKSRAAADALNLPRAYASYDEVLDDAMVAAVHLTVPNHLHFDIARRALQAGKHVMCEKPLAMNTAESAELVRLAREHPRLAAAVNYNMRFYPLCIEIRELVRCGDLGELFHVSGSYAQDWLLLASDYNWRVLADQGGPLRTVADIGTHWLDLVHATTGLEIEALCADLQTVHPVRLRPQGEIETFTGKQAAGSPAATRPVEITTEDYGGVMLRFRGGARGILWVSQVTAGRKNCLRLEISGSRQAVAWNSERPDELWIGRREEANRLLLRDPALISEAARTAISYPGGHNEGYADTFKQCFAAFYRYIEAADFSAEPPLANFADGHRELALCEAVLRSHHEHRWVEVPN